jgi:hypothetical protein
MNRRALVFVSILLLSGCSGVTTNPMTPENTATDTLTRPTETRSPPSVSAVNYSIEPRNLGWPFPPYNKRPEAGPGYIVGECSTPQFDGMVDAYVWNPTPENRTLTVFLSYGQTETIFHETIRLSPYETRGFRFEQSGQYLLTVEYMNQSERKPITIEPSDCNDKAHGIWIDRSGIIDDRTLNCSVL